MLITVLQFRDTLVRFISSHNEAFNTRFTSFNVLDMLLAVFDLFSRLTNTRKRDEILSLTEFTLKTVFGLDKNLTAFLEFFRH
jgi:hypothetical protein